MISSVNVTKSVRNCENSKIHRKTPVLEPFLNKVLSLRTATLLKEE